jgi:hypothetical protein
MNTNLLNIVKQIIAEQGEAILADPARLKPFIKDYAQNIPQDERRAFGRCIEAGAYTGLKNVHTQAERKQVKAAFLPHIQAASGIPAAQCREALNVLEAAIFGMPQSASQPPQYAPPNQSGNQMQYQQPQSFQSQSRSQPQPVIKTGGLWTAVLICNIFGLNWISRFITGHAFTGVLVFLLDIITIVTFSIGIGVILSVAGLVIWIVDLVKIGTRKWQMKDGTYLSP